MQYMDAKKQQCPVKETNSLLALWSSVEAPNKLVGALHTYRSVFLSLEEKKNSLVILENRFYLYIFLYMPIALQSRSLISCTHTQTHRKLPCCIWETWFLLKHSHTLSPLKKVVLYCFNSWAVKPYLREVFTIMIERDSVCSLTVGRHTFQTGETVF